MFLFARARSLVAVLLEYLGRKGEGLKRQVRNDVREMIGSNSFVVCERMDPTNSFVVCETIGSTSFRRLAK